MQRKRKAIILILRLKKKHFFFISILCFELNVDIQLFTAYFPSIIFIRLTNKNKEKDEEVL